MSAKIQVGSQTQCYGNFWLNASDSNSSDQTDSDDDIEGNADLKKELKDSSSPFPTAMYNIDGPNISASEIVNIAPGEGQWNSLLL